MDNIDSIFIDFFKQIRIYMLVHSHHINSALQQSFQESFKPDNQVNLWLHIYTDIYVTAFFLFVP